MNEDLYQVIIDECGSVDGIMVCINTCFFKIVSYIQYLFFLFIDIIIYNSHAISKCGELGINTGGKLNTIAPSY